MKKEELFKEIVSCAWIVSNALLLVVCGKLDKKQKRMRHVANQERIYMGSRIDELELKDKLRSEELDRHRQRIDDMQDVINVIVSENEES